MDAPVFSNHRIDYMNTSRFKGTVVLSFIKFMDKLLRANGGCLGIGRR
jgi:hypothetical protein